MDLQKELSEVLNRHSRENKSDTPDFILAQYLLGCLEAFEAATTKREKWYGREPKPSLVPLDSTGSEQP